MTTIPRPRGVKLSEAQEHTICRLYRMGRTMKVIGQGYGVSPTRIMSVLRRHGVQSRPDGMGRRMFGAETEHEIRTRYESGETSPNLARDYGCSHKSVLSAVRRAGGVVRPAPCVGREPAPPTPLDLWMGNLADDTAEAPDDASTPLVAEATLRDSLAADLRQEGHTVYTEVIVGNGGRCDIAVGNEHELRLIIEVKTSDPLKGIGQLFAYRAGWDPKPDVALAVPANVGGLAATKAACREAGVELWVVRPDSTVERIDS